MCIYIHHLYTLILNEVYLQNLVLVSNLKFAAEILELEHTEMSVQPFDQAHTLWALLLKNVFCSTVCPLCLCSAKGTLISDCCLNWT